MRILVYLLGTLICCVAVADPPLTITDAGYWLTYVDSSGIPAYQKIEDVRDLRGLPAPPRDEPPQTPEIPETPRFDLDLVTNTETWAREMGDPLTAQAISAVYAHVGVAYEDGIVSQTALWIVLRDASDKAIVVAASGKDWKSFRAKISDIVTLRQQQGTLGDKKEVSILLRSVKQGLDQAADGSIALSIDKLIKIAASTNGVIDAN